MRSWKASERASFAKYVASYTKEDPFEPLELDCSVLAELVEDAPSLAPMAGDDVADVDDVQDDEEGEFDEAASMREERNPLQDLAPSRISQRSGSSAAWDRQYARRPGVELIWYVEVPLLGVKKQIRAPDVTLMLV